MLLPFYKENEAVVRETLEALAQSRWPKERLLVVLGREERAGEGAREIAARLEKDFGHGIGDMLDSSEHIDSSKYVADDASEKVSRGALKVGAKKLSIASILKQSSSKDDLIKVVPQIRPRAIAPIQDPTATTKKLALVVIFLFLVAAGGVFMLAMKNGMPDTSQVAAFVQNFSFIKKNTQSVVPQSTQKLAPPSSVNVVVVIGSQGVQSGEKPFVFSRNIESDIKTTKVFQTTGEGQIATGRSTGIITVTNKTAKSYTFVATTRFLSSEGILFHLKKTTLIPANDSVDVKVYADKLGSQGDIGPSLFTIPGLSLSLQSEIFGKSDAAMSGGTGKTRVISESDIASAKAVLSEQLGHDAEENFKSMVVDGEKLHSDLITSSEISVIAPPVGTVSDSFSLTLSLKFRALLIPEKEILPLLTKELGKAVSDTNDSLGIPMYVVQAYDTQKERAEVRVEALIMR